MLFKFLILKELFIILSNKKNITLTKNTGIRLTIIGLIIAVIGALLIFGCHAVMIRDNQAVLSSPAPVEPTINDAINSTIPPTEPIVEFIFFETAPSRPFYETPEVTEVTEPPVDESPSEETPDMPSEPVEAPETNETESGISEDDVELLACVIYQEAGSDAVCDDCRRRVADVVLNRVESEYFPDTIYEVLMQPSQYGAYSMTGVVWPERASYETEAHAVERARRIAREVLSGQHSDLYGDGYIWQAGFEQGSQGFWDCGMYFGKG